MHWDRSDCQENSVSPKPRHVLWSGLISALGRENEIGSLEAGKSADFIVLDRDRCDLADAATPNRFAIAEVLETSFMGRKAYLPTSARCTPHAQQLVLFGKSVSRIESSSRKVKDRRERLPAARMHKK